MIPESRNRTLARLAYAHHGLRIVSWDEDTALAGVVEVAAEPHGTELEAIEEWHQLCRDADREDRERAVEDMARKVERNRERARERARKFVQAKRESGEWDERAGTRKAGNKVEGE